MQQPLSDKPTSADESPDTYPDQPVVAPDSRHVVVRFNGQVVADSHRTLRVLQRGIPPSFYIPPEDVRVEWLVASDLTIWCPYKGDANHYDLVIGEATSANAAWCYPEPLEPYREIQYAIAFYANRVDACTVDGEEVTGDDSGGWITSEIVAGER